MVILFHLASCFFCLCQSFLVFLMQQLTLRSLHAGISPSLCSLQCALRISALSKLTGSRYPQLQPALQSFSHALAVAGPAGPSWVAAASLFQQQVLDFAMSQEPAGQAVPGSVDGLLDALLTSSLSVTLLTASCGATEAATVARLPVLELVHECTQAARTVCLEKWGCSPTFAVRSSSAALQGSVPCLAVPSLLAHSLTELLKNAAKSLQQRYGVLGLDDAPEILVTPTLSPGLLALAVQDSGAGLAAPLQPEQRRFPYFASAWGQGKDGPVASQEGSDWRYSRNFGSALYGKGVGLARAALHARVHGGSLVLRHSAGGGGGVTATLTMATDGASVFDPHPLLQ